MKAETFLKSFGALANAPGGVQKLRELVLQLGVMGKLVPQDPNDEPADVLLEKITKEKERLLREGEIKKTKKFVGVQPTEVAFELPYNWAWSRLGNLGEIGPRNTADDSTEAGFVPMPLISETYSTPMQHEARRWGEIKKGYTHIANGDVVLAKITPCFQNRKSTVISDLPNGIGAGTTELHVFRPIDGSLDAAYVLIFLKSPEFVLHGIPKMTGSAGQKRVPRSHFTEAPFPVPPLAEQKRIVAKVDELMALCDELEKRQDKAGALRTNLNESALNSLLSAENSEEFARHWQRVCENFDLLYDNPDNVRKLRQAILQLAVMGKLVAQNPDDEPASVLLEKIAKEKERLVKEGKIKKGKVLAPVETGEIPFSVPQGWGLYRAENISEQIVDCPHSTAKFQDTGKACLDTTCMEPGRIVLERLRYVSSKTFDERNRRLAPQEGDVVLAREGRIGTAVSLPATPAVCLGQRVMLLRPGTGFNSRYLELTLMAPSTRAHYETKKLGSTVGHVNVADIRALPLAVPPEAEQKRIVAKVDELMALCDELESKLTAAREQASKLAGAVVAELVA